MADFLSEFFFYICVCVCVGGGGGGGRNEKGRTIESNRVSSRLPH